MALRGFLELPDGMAIRIGPAGLLIGRHSSCDLQLAAETASRRHALLRLADDGVELIVLGRHPVAVEGHDVATSEVVRDGAEVDLPGLTCRIRIERAEDPVAVTYALRRGGERFPIRTSPFVLGAVGRDDAMKFVLAQDELTVELAEPGLLDGVAILPGTPVVVREGNALELRGQVFRIERATDDPATTVAAIVDRGVREVVLQPLPRGGRVTFKFADGDRGVYLPGRRYKIIAALLAPPAPLVAGEFVPDSELVPLVWNDTDDVGGRAEVNVVITRTRSDLAAAGIAATNLLERAPGGRATRIVLAPGCRVSIVD